VIESFSGLTARQFAHRVVIHADTQMVVVIGTPLPGNRNGPKAFGEPGVEEATRDATVIAAGGYPGTRAVIPHRRRARDEPLVAWRAGHRLERVSVGELLVARECCRKGEERGEEVAVTFVSEGQASVAAEPGDGAFDGPAVAAEAC
jgi:hypothetical protein